MIKNTGRLDQLFTLHLNQSATEMEQEEFWGYVNDPMYEGEVKELIAALYSESDNLSMISEDEHAQILGQVFSKHRLSAAFSVPAKGKLNLWPLVAGIAAAIALITVGVYFFNSQPKPVSGTENYANDIKPGTNSATLMLSNGKRIKLTDAVNGELAEESGVTVTKMADGQLIYEIKDLDADPNKFNTLSTEKGETYILILPDKSKVWLNAASSLTYTPSLNENGKRIVKLTGEAYFEVAKDKRRPFIVQSQGQDVEVLGTHFNINSYQDETMVSTTLLEGSVKIKAAGKHQILKPGEQANNNGTMIEIAEANVENVLDWKEGDFFLNRVNFKTAMRKIARWYDVEIIYDDPIADDIESGGWISRKNNLSVVLNALESTGMARFKIDGKKVHVYK